MTSSNLVRLNTRSQPLSKLEQMGTGALLLSWLLLNGTSLFWLVQTVQEISSFNQILLLAGVAFLLIQGVRHRQQFQFSAVPTLRWMPLVLLLSSALGTIAARWFLILDQVPVVFALLGTYGLLGLFLEPGIWRKGLPIGVAISLILPFGAQYTTGLGFPARILTAHLVEFLLKTWKVVALSSEDIIVLDTGIARVDLPCSGLRSLWTGTLFFLITTWLERRQFGLRWLVIFLANLGMLVIINVARVLTLVLVAQGWQQSALAEILHVPLGVIGFMAACGFTLLLLRWVPRQATSVQPESGQANDPSNSVSNSKISFLLTACFLALMLVPHPPTVAALPDLTRLNWSIAAQPQAIPLTPTEQEFFATDPRVVVSKQRFNDGGLTGSVLFVASPRLQMHHAPELCLIGSGFHLDHMISQLFEAGLSARWLSLDQKKQTAVYWFQSPQQTTGDFLTRFWQEASRQQSSWTLVSILFDDFHPPTDPKLQAIVTEIYRSLNQTLQKA
ncbi:exosortase O [Kovacikia minuta CCNUW1]|uniref:exosortase O n=1 Tax=Kovacikia minuta TaxID=2931930 RepID=UPI001CCAEEFC|nr:exosortase O [Kovacikia minuta]UBF25496.1 exosortase O [Kovacikia minuta CCNUW1]